MKLIYISGPHIGSTYHQTEAYITYAREWAEKLAHAGHAFYCPHLNTAHFDTISPDVPESFWREMNANILRRCDAVLLLPGWDNEEATRRDVEFAENARVPVIVDIDEIADLRVEKTKRSGS